MQSTAVRRHRRARWISAIAAVFFGCVMSLGVLASVALAAPASSLPTLPAGLSGQL